MNRKMIIFSLSLVMLAAISGCGNVNDPSMQESSLPETSSAESTTAVPAENTEPETSMEASTAKTTQPETDIVDFTSIDGDWYIDGDKYTIENGQTLFQDKKKSRKQRKYVIFGIVVCEKT